MTSHKPKTWKAWGVFHLNIEGEIDGPPDYLARSRHWARECAKFYSFPIRIRPVVITLAKPRRKTK